jgi:hypothetical protein
MSDATQQQRLIQARTEWNRMFASTTTDHNDNPTHSARPSNSIITLSTLNMQNNTHWGDKINQQKPENTTRIYCQN